MANDNDIQGALHKTLFHRIDANNDGFITVDELKKSLQNNSNDIGEYFELCEEGALHMADVNNDGKIHPEEFVNAIHTQPKFAEFLNRITGGLYRNQLLRDKFEIDKMDAKFEAQANKEEREIFAGFDDDGDGVVNIDEFLNSMGVMDLGFSYEELVEIYGEEMASFFVDTEKREKFTRRFANFDKDGDKSMNFKEFKTYVRKQDLMDKFEEFDADMSGVLGIEEIRSAMQQMKNPFIDQDKVEKFFAEADTDGNGIDFNEFVDAFDQFFTE
jgi:Ca2+-binding EF-hand superfamily protein